ncbi:MAG: hypothetical protein ACXVEF_07090 [Polyangiales bacterium]
MGRGLAVLSIDAEIESGRQGACTFDATAAVRAREEGRAAPELIAFRIAEDGKTIRVGGPSESIHAIVHGSSVRIVALLRGDRFALVPLAVDREVRAKSSRFSAHATSVWGTHAIAGTASFIQSGVPVLVSVDTARDHERTSIAFVVDRDPVQAIVLDAGPILGELAIGTEEARKKELAKGGAAALSVLLSELPLSVASAPSDAAAVERLREAARAARAAVLSSDPLVNAAGERLLTAVLNGFTSCRRSAEPGLPPRWPAPRRDLVATGILEDAETGCPHIDELLRTNHPDVRFTREGDLAVRDAASSAELPQVGPLVPGGARPNAEPAKPRKTQGALFAFAFAAAVLAFFLWDRGSA